MTDSRLVVFDVDGTLVDSQAHVLAAMARAFEGANLAPPDRAATLSIVGLSLPVAMARLAPGAPGRVDALVAGYKAAFAALRAGGDPVARSPLYPGARACLERLAAEPGTLLGIATGKSQRGLDHLLAQHGLRPFFRTLQVADDHPSKPNPAMLEACLRETGVAPAQATIVGDTSYDMEMGRAASVRAIGVGWGYHSADLLRQAGAAHVIDRFEALPDALCEALSLP